MGFADDATHTSGRVVNTALAEIDPHQHPTFIARYGCSRYTFDNHFGGSGGDFLTVLLACQYVLAKLIRSFIAFNR